MIKIEDNKFVIELPEGYSIEDAFKDAAIAMDYSPTLETRETKVINGDLVTVEETIDNPLSDIEYGKLIWEEVVRDKVLSTRALASAKLKQQAMDKYFKSLSERPTVDF